MAKNIVRLPVLAAIAALWITLLWIHQANGQQDELEPINLLNLDGFRVSARVRVIRSNSNRVDQEIFINEYYSNIERRSRLDIQFVNRIKTIDSLRPKVIQYYYDGSPGARQLIRLTNTRRDDCSLVDEQKLADDLFGEMSSADQHLTSVEWLKERDNIPDYIVGFARLLAILDANKKRMRQTNEKNSALIRNRESTKYTLQDPLGSGSLPGEESKLVIYYGKSNQDESKGLPLRVWFVHPSRAEIIVDYSRFSRIDFDVMAANDFIGTYHSFLMFPLHTGCSGLLAKTDLLQDRPAPKLVSFRLKIEDSFDDTSGKKYFLAYDGFMGMLRRDEIDDTKDGAISTTIYDYKATKKYNIRYGPLKLPAGSGEFNPIDTRESQCAVAWIKQEQAPNLDSLIPFKELVRMGYGFVRGIEVLVFEQISSTLPEIFVTQTSSGPQPSGNTRKSETFSINYSIVYYFAAPTLQQQQQQQAGNGSVLQVGDQNLGPLIRVKAVKKGLTQFVMDLEEFVWQLADAPNGDPSNELFSLKDSCYGESLKQNNFANMKLELNFAPGQAEKLDQTFYLSAVNNTLKRNKALIRGLNGAGIASTLIYDLNSKLYKQENSMRIYANAKLNYQNQVLYEAVFVGAGAWGLGTQLTEAETFDDCFWDAMHLRKLRGEILFTFCFSICRIDLNVEVSYDKTGSNNSVKVIKSEGFSFGSVLSTCKIFSLKLIDNADTANEFARKSSFKDMREKLRGGQLTLPVMASDAGEVDEVQLVVKMIQIGNDRWLDSVENSGTVTGKNGSQILINEGIFKGIGLMIGSGSTTRVQPRQIKTEGNDNGDEDDDYGEDNSRTMMSYSLCHSTCLATMKCRSFSLCSSGSGQLECLISEVEFRDPAILDKIAQQVSEVSVKRTTISLQLTTSGINNDQAGGDISDDQQMITPKSTTADADDSNRMIELRVDRRCHLYNKQALELFQPPEQETSIEVKSNYLVGVDSAEQCAEICLQRNKRFFKLAVKRRKHSMKTIQPEENGLVPLAKLRVLEGRNLRSWCQSFSYIAKNEIVDEQQLETVRDKIDPQKLNNKNGLCYPANGRSKVQANRLEETKKKGTGNETISLTMYKFNFVYSSLYEPKYGIKLRPVKTVQKSDHEQMSMDEIRQFIRDGNTQVVSRIDDVETCARICFLQMVDLEPWCQSFGQFREYVKSSGNSAAPEQQSYCIFNTISMAAALQSPLSSQLISPVPKNMTFCHYEPRNLLDLESVVLNQLSSDDELLTSNRSTGTFMVYLARFKFSPIGIFILLALSLVSGLGLVKFIVATLLVGRTNNVNEVGERSATDDVTVTQRPTNTNGSLMAKISGIIGRPGGRDIDLARLVRGGDIDDGDNDDGH